jgi:hypothetical protein
MISSAHDWKRLGYRGEREGHQVEKRDMLWIWKLTISAIVTTTGGRSPFGGGEIFLRG